MRPYIFLALAVALNACSGSGESDADGAKQVQLQGEAQGTTWHISYVDTSSINHKQAIDSIFVQIDKSLSTYVADSRITSFNKGNEFASLDDHMANVLMKSASIYKLTDAAFDPTVFPLIDFWGFGTEKIMVIDKISTDVLDSIRAFVGLDKVLVIAGQDTLPLTEAEQLSDQSMIGKTQPEVQLNFNAIAQGYTVDVLCAYLEANGIQRYMVEVGGEVRVKGNNAKDKLWTIGIDKPVEQSVEHTLGAVVQLDNQSVATSGNYRKYYEKDGVKYSHTLNPKSGFPVQHSLLSATVVANDCMTADALATAFMVVGIDQAKAYVQQLDDVEAYFIYSSDEGEMTTWMSEGISSQLEEI